MNMQDYRHAADRVHIAAHCRQEVLNMTKHTQPKTRKPLIRMAAGIAAGAAVLAITGGFAYLMLSVQSDIRNPGASNPEQQPATEYIEIFRDYYETRAGHPIDFDFSTLCGTDFNETWEFADYTVTLNAAVCDGWQFDYIYTIQPHSGQMPTAAELNNIPSVNIRSTEDPVEFVVCDVQLVDTELRADGTFRGVGSCHYTINGMVTSLPEQFYAQCQQPGRTYNPQKFLADGTLRPITVNQPDELPACIALTDSLTATVDRIKSAAYKYAFVTPLGITLTNYTFDDIEERLNTAESNSYSGPAVTDAVTVQKGFCHGEPTDIGVTYDQTQAAGIIGIVYTNSPDFATCWLPFTEPQNLADITYLSLTSNEQSEAVQIPLNSRDCYIDCFRDYYETRAGHPVDFDFLALCGTEFDEVWEFDDYTVTLNAAICDGWEIDYIYTLQPKYGQILDLAILPELTMSVADASQATVIAVCDQPQVIAQLEADGTLRMFSSCHYLDRAMPIPQDGQIYAVCTEADQENGLADGTVRPITVNMPEDVPEIHPLDDILKIHFGSASVTQEFVYGVVTPLGIILTNYDPKELDTLLHDVYAEPVTDRTEIALCAAGNLDADDVTVQNIDLAFGTQISVGTDRHFYLWQDPALGEATYATCWLPFTEPQNLDDVQNLMIGSNAQGETVIVPIK